MIRLSAAMLPACIISAGITCQLTARLGLVLVRGE